MLFVSSIWEAQYATQHKRSISRSLDTLPHSVASVSAPPKSTCHPGNPPSSLFRLWCVQYDDSDLSSDDEEVEMDVAEAKTDGTFR